MHFLLRKNAAALAAAGLAALAVPAASSAGYQTFGSDLAAKAEVVHAHQADTAYWMTQFADHRLPTVPVEGQIKEVRIKGYAVTDRAPGSVVGVNDTLFHIQAYEDAGNGLLRARITSQGFDLPNKLNGNADSITSYFPENFCVKPGDTIGFNHIGGWDGDTSYTGPYRDGTPLQIFAKSPGASMTWFEANGFWHDQSTTHSPMTPRPGHVHDRGGKLQEELLMQMVVATGDDRSYECGGSFNPYRPPDPPPRPRAPKPPPAPPAPQKTTFPSGQRVNVKKNGTASMALFCQAGGGRCAGKVTIYAKETFKQNGLKRTRTIAIGQARYSIGQKSTAGVKVRLTKKGHKLFLKRNRKLPVTILAVTGAGGPELTEKYRVTLKKVGSK